MIKKRAALTFIAALLVLATLACALSFNRNPDGSLGVETVLTEEMIQESLNNSSAQWGGDNEDIKLSNLDADLRDGYIFVVGDLQYVEGGAVDQLSFRLDLYAENGQLVVLMSDVQVENYSVDPLLVNEWNQKISDELTDASQQTPNASLDSVTVAEDGVTFLWRVSNP